MFRIVQKCVIFMVKLCCVLFSLSVSDWKQLSSVRTSHLKSFSKFYWFQFSQGRNFLCHKLLKGRTCRFSEFDTFLDKLHIFNKSFIWKVFKEFLGHFTCACSTLLGFCVHYIVPIRRFLWDVFEIQNKTC